MQHMKFGKNQLYGLEELSFENVEGRTKAGWTTDDCPYYKLTYELSAQVSQ